MGKSTHVPSGILEGGAGTPGSSLAFQKEPLKPKERRQLRITEEHPFAGPSPRPPGSQASWLPSH